ncbi:MAG: hypothetical protein QOJ85_4363 [Solirubrobacteraceae bacterium]|jgi:uncharacterized membrane protein|nr:hypothetical protein [Solirubrobacteraceae bacterium]
MSGHDRWAWLRDPRADEQEVERLGVAAAGALARRDPLWPGQLAILVALGLFLTLPPKLTVGPNWPLPAAEAGVLAALVIAGRRGADVRRRRQVAIGLVLVATLANLTALGLLTHYLVTGGRAQSTDLIGGGVVIWSTNLLLFAVLYWELDRGGPRPAVEHPTPVAPDFLFTQQPTAGHWKPGFIDYLYVSLTNQSAFSPTDTMPLTPRMKILMGTQGTAALVTVGVIVARAVNLLG